jgi:Na+-translocating ferredoxin:NAD+ oxidoreductase RnfD subunit
VLIAALVDMPIIRARGTRWEFPSGAILTGLIIAVVLSLGQPWYVAGCTSAVAILSKYIFRTRSANVFNPAAFAIVATFYVFGTIQSWWGALSEVTPALDGRAVRHRHLHCRPRQQLPLSCRSSAASTCFFTDGLHPRARHRRRDLSAAEVQMALSSHSSS